MTRFARVTFSVFAFAGVAYPQASQNDLRILNIKAIQASNSGQFDQACELYAHELDLLLAQSRHVEAATVYTEIGEIEQIQRKFPAAEISYQKGLALFRHYAQPNDLRFVTALDDLGWLYVTWNRPRQAARLMSEAHEKAAHVSPNDPGLLRHLDTQAAYLSVGGRYSEAERDWKRALAIGDSLFGSDSPNDDNLLVHFGQASARYGDYTTAADMFRRYLSIEDHVKGSPPTSRATAAGELAHVYSEQHKFPDAKRWFDESIGIFTSEPDAEPLTYSLVVSYLGDYYMAQRDWGMHNCNTEKH